MNWESHMVRRLAAWKYALAAKEDFAHEVFCVVMLLMICVPAMAIVGGLN